MASQVTPTNIPMASAAMSTSVAEALRDLGRRKNGTPLLTASTPVSAVQPDAKARRTTNSSAKPASGEASTGRCADGASTGCPAPAAITALTSRNATAATKP